MHEDRWSTQEYVVWMTPTLSHLFSPLTFIPGTQPLSISSPLPVNAPGCKRLFINCMWPLFVHRQFPCKHSFFFLQLWGFGLCTAGAIQRTSCIVIESFFQKEKFSRKQQPHILHLRPSQPQLSSYQVSGWNIMLKCFCFWLMIVFIN